jgi:hypothetical protein
MQSMGCMAESPNMVATPPANANFHNGKTLVGGISIGTSPGSNTSCSGSDKSSSSLGMDALWMKAPPRPIRLVREKAKAVNHCLFSAANILFTQMIMHKEKREWRLTPECDDFLVMSFL